MISLLFALAASAQTPNLCDVRKQGLDYVLQSQQTQDSRIYHTGEWTSQIAIHGLPYKAGVLYPGPFEDANVFTVASVQNALAEVYAFDPDPRIRSALAAARDAFPRYQMRNGGFNFWPKDPRAGKDGHMPVERITHKMYDGFVTVPADADDTAVVYYSLAQDEKIVGGSPRFRTLDRDQLASLFSKYTDSFRIAFPRVWERKKLWTGAFFTWLERGPILPIISSAFFPSSIGPRVVLGENTVDCVVNANTLRTLAMNRVTDTKGYQGSCNYLNDMAEHERYNTCGFYYPDTYWMHYATVRAYDEGAKCLAPAVAMNLQHLLRNQRADGSWHNEVEQEDDSLATALAASALVKSGSAQNPKHVAALRRALAYLSAKQVDGHWPGGVFFSAGHPARSTVLWRSDAFTTALTTELFYEAQSWFPSETCH